MKEVCVSFLCMDVYGKLEVKIINVLVPTQDVDYQIETALRTYCNDVKVFPITTVRYAWVFLEDIEKHFESLWSKLDNV